MSPSLGCGLICNYARQHRAGMRDAQCWLSTDLQVRKFNEVVPLIGPPVIGLDAEDAQIARRQALEDGQHAGRVCDV